MPTAPKIPRTYWVTPILGLVIGLVYLVAFSIGGHPLEGVAGLGVMVAFSVVIALAGLRSETVRGLLDRRDERITSIDLRATAVSALAMVVAILIGFSVEVAQGHSGSPYVIIAVVGGLSYVAAVGYFRIRA